MHNVRFYETALGQEVVLDKIRSLSKEDKNIVGEDLMTVQIGFPMGLPLCDNLGNGLWEVRSTISSGREFRAIFYQSKREKSLVVVNVLIKKTQTTPKAALRLSLKRKQEFESK